MKDYKQLILSKGKVIAKAMIVSLLLFLICRIIFHIHNHSSFKSLGFIETIKLYFDALLFDTSAIALINILFIITFILPLPTNCGKVQNTIARFLFVVFNSIAIAFNIFDAAFFPFTNKRLTVDMLGFGGNNSNFIKLLPRFALDYWYLIIAFIFIVYFLYKWSKKNITNNNSATFKIGSSVAAFFTNLIFWSGLLLLFFRGWFIRIPLSMVDASKYASVQNTPLLLNTVFTIAKSVGTDMIVETHYFKTDDEAIAIYNPISKPTGKLFNKRNVVVIMVESLSKEFMGSLSNLPTYTPFLDSLSKHSLVFTDAYANGKQSVQGIPAVTGSLPSIMNGFFINTPYINNNYKGLGTLFTEQGYYTAFMHGAHNGSMNFDAYAKQAGYKDYLGRQEYNNEKDFDGDWGIWDEEFLQFGVRKMSECKKPFHFSIFTLSSHHPYFIPRRYEQKFVTKSENPLCRVIEYADYSLQQFFNSAKKQDWYNNTIFVITADHTGESRHSFYSNTVGQYQIPILIFDPQQNVQQLYSQTVSQADILPTILHKLNYPQSSFSFGNDVFAKPSFGIYYTNNQYQIVQNGYVLSFDGSKSTALYHFNNDSLLQKNLLQDVSQFGIKTHLENTLKAYVQQYNSRIINNKMMVK